MEANKKQNPKIVLTDNPVKCYFNFAGNFKDKVISIINS